MAAMGQVSAANWVRVGQHRFEKCEVAESGWAYEQGLKAARAEKDVRAEAEALMGLIRVAGETLAAVALETRVRELRDLVARVGDERAPHALYGLAAGAMYSGDYPAAKTLLLRHVKLLRRHLAQDSELLQPLARGYAMLAKVAFNEGKLRRVEVLVRTLLKRYEALKLRSINGIAYLTLGSTKERQREYDEAQSAYQQAHSYFLEEHNWYHHLYVLFGYARVAFAASRRTEVAWTLDLIDRATARNGGAEFALIRKDLARWRKALEDDAVDLLIDGDHGLIRSKDKGQVNLRKQYVLLDILRVLSQAEDRGVSKAEIIQKVWKQSSKSPSHFNKLYYNINRLRKILEKDASRPQVLLNWKEGYRFAPGLRVQFVAEAARSQAKGGNTQ